MDARETVAVHRAPCSPVGSAPNQRGAAGNYKSGAITQQQLWQEPCCTLFELQDSFTHCLFQWAWTMQAECALCCRAGDSSPWIGGELQKRPVQIRRDGFIMHLKCQLLQKSIPRLHSTDWCFELTIIPAKTLQSPRCKTIIQALRNTQDQWWLSCWQRRS